MLKYFTNRKLQIRTIERYHYTPKRMAKNEEKKKKPDKAISGEDTEETGPYSREKWGIGRQGKGNIVRSIFF